MRLTNALHFKGRFSHIREITAIHLFMSMSGSIVHDPNDFTAARTANCQQQNVAFSAFT